MPAASRPSPSPSTVRRWLADDAIKPWQHRSWIFPRDPRFARKARRALDLYQREREGQQLGDDEYVLFDRSSTRQNSFPWLYEISCRQRSAGFGDTWLEISVDRLNELAAIRTRRAGICRLENGS